MVDSSQFIRSIEDPFSDLSRQLSDGTEMLLGANIGKARRGRPVGIRALF